MRGRVLVVCACAVLVAACGTTSVTDVGSGAPSPSPTASGSPSPSSSPSAQGGDVLGLIGNWTATGPGVERGTVVTIDADEMRIWTRCGLTSASWDADPSGLFAADITSWSNDCFTARARWPWAVSAHSWSRASDAVELRATTGEVTARLEPGGTPTTGPDVAAELGSPRPLTAEDRRRLGAHPALPPGLAPAAADDLVGTWVVAPTASAAGVDDLGPGVEVDADGTWSGTDGCNGGDGSWTLGPDGAFIATLGPMSAVGCPGPSVPYWMSEARRVGLAGSALVLVGRDGKELGRLVRR
ncbi:MAG: hypothetical protein U0S36_07680 [Candidatus Nanopelagicales bacterium]